VRRIAEYWKEHLLAVPHLGQGADAGANRQVDSLADRRDP